MFTRLPLDCTAVDVKYVVHNTLAHRGFQQLRLACYRYHTREVLAIMEDMGSTFQGCGTQIVVLTL